MFDFMFAVVGGGGGAAFFSTNAFKLCPEERYIPRKLDQITRNKISEMSFKMENNIKTAPARALEFEFRMMAIHLQ